MKRLKEAMGNELILVAGADAIVWNPSGEFLITQRRYDGKWELPGGAIDPGETPAEAVQREVREETGLEVRVVRLAGAFGGRQFRHEYPDGQRIEAVSLLFDCEVTGGRLGNTDGEATDFRFVSVATMPPLAWTYPALLFDASRTGALFI